MTIGGDLEAVDKPADDGASAKEDHLVDHQVECYLLNSLSLCLSLLEIILGGRRTENPRFAIIFVSSRVLELEPEWGAD